LIAWSFSLSNEAVEQGDEADEAKHIGASQLIPGVGLTKESATRQAFCVAFLESSASQ
jgi:hypothetical protein